MTLTEIGPEPPEDLPPKPAIEDMPSEKGVPAPGDSDEDEIGEIFMAPDDAREDPTVDDQEQPEQEA